MSAPGRLMQGEVSQVSAARATAYAPAVRA
ncbi:hypothetical protein M2168_002648 [Streptomyces sp. CZ24]|nr:hypothetical protein [Streptomyces sp. CZ24]